MAYSLPQTKTRTLGEMGYSVLMVDEFPAVEEGENLALVHYQITTKSSVIDDITTSLKNVEIPGIVVAKLAVYRQNHNSPHHHQTLTEYNVPNSPHYGTITKKITATTTLLIYDINTKRRDNPLFSSYSRGHPHHHHQQHHRSARAHDILASFWTHTLHRNLSTLRRLAFVYVVEPDTQRLLGDKICPREGVAFDKFYRAPCEGMEFLCPWPRLRRCEPAVITSSSNAGANASLPRMGGGGGGGDVSIEATDQDEDQDEHEEAEDSSWADLTSFDPEDIDSGQRRRQSAPPPLPTFQGRKSSSTSFSSSCGTPATPPPAEIATRSHSARGREHPAAPDENECQDGDRDGIDELSYHDAGEKNNKETRGENKNENKWQKSRLVRIVARLVDAYPQVDDETGEALRMERIVFLPYRIRGSLVFDMEVFLG